MEYKDVFKKGNTQITHGDSHPCFYMTKSTQRHSDREMIPAIHTPVFI